MEHNEEFVAIRKKAKDLENEKQELSAVIEHLREEKVNELHDSYDQNVNLQTKVDALERSNSELSSKIKNIMKTRKEHHALIDDQMKILRNEKCELKSEIKDLKLENQRWKDKFSEGEKNFKNMKFENEALQQSLEKHQPLF